MRLDIAHRCDRLRITCEDDGTGIDTEAVRRAQVADAAVDALYFTGGSTGLAALTARIGAAFPRAQRVSGDRFASVAGGLGIYARRLFDGTRSA